jgi:hypothetical protein
MLLTLALEPQGTRSTGRREPIPGGSITAFLPQTPVDRVPWTSSGQVFNY